jgi:hypothetical protein
METEHISQVIESASAIVNSDPAAAKAKAARATKTPKAKKVKTPEEELAAQKKAELAAQKKAELAAKRQEKRAKFFASLDERLSTIAKDPRFEDQDIACPLCTAKCCKVTELCILSAPTAALERAIAHNKLTRETADAVIALAIASNNDTAFWADLDKKIEQSMESAKMALTKTSV